MSRHRLIDTNLIVRYLVQDHPKHAEVAGKIFAACDAGEITILLLSAVLAECVFVLESFYKHPRERIAETLAALVASPGVELRDAAIHQDALTRYAETRLHFVDCLIAAHAASRRIPVASFDRDFKKFKDVQVKNG